MLPEKQFQQAQKMESVGHLAGGVAPDFNNMLGVILGYAEITRQLLAFARKQTVAPKSLNLNDKVPGVLNMQHRLVGEDIDLSWRPVEEEPGYHRVLMWSLP